MPTASHTGLPTAPQTAAGAAPGLGTARGVVRLINSSAGGVLCLAGVIDSAALGEFVGRHGREPVRVAAVDAGSVTALTPSALEFLLDHLEVAERTGRQVSVVLSPAATRALDDARARRDGGADHRR